MDPNQLKAFVDQDEETGGVPAPKKSKQKKGPTDQELAEQCGQAIENGEVDQDVMDLMLTDFDPTDLPPVWAPNQDVWDRAMKAVDPEGQGGDKWTDPYAVVAHLYKKLGGEIDAEEGEEGGDHEEPDGDEDGEQSDDHDYGD